MMKKNRMRVPRVRTPQQDHLALFNLAVRTRPAPRPENRRQTGDARRVSSPVASVDVIRADHRAHKLLRHVVQLIRGFRTTEHPKRPRAMLFDLLAKSRGNPVQRLIPACRTMLPLLAKQWRGQSFLHRIAHTPHLLPISRFHNTRKPGNPDIPTLLTQDVFMLQLQCRRTSLTYLGAEPEMRGK